MSQNKEVLNSLKEEIESATSIKHLEDHLTSLKQSLVEEIKRRERLNKTMIEKELNKKANMELVELMRSKIDKLRPNDLEKFEVIVKSNKKYQWNRGRGQNQNQDNFNPPLAGEG